MRIGIKHQNQQTIVRADFSGGLNTSANVDGIAENQLSVAVNVEVDHATGRLKTVAGTTDILYLNNIFAAMYDEINQKLLLVTANKTVYATNLNTLETLGTLNGSLYPSYTSWESGILIATGGKLQYYNGTQLLTLNSPNATSVYIRAGRVLVTDENNVRYSGVGDENNWTEDTNDDSSSKFVEAGYKDGGKLIGMVNLSQDILLIKNNRRLYRLSGEFPNWSINEVSRNAEVSGRMSFCAVADSVFILGRNEVQNIQTTADYGDMKPNNVSTLITSEIQNLPANTPFRYVPPLNQLWAINRKSVLLFDLVTNSWYKREFNSPVIDVISIGNEVLIIITRPIDYSPNGDDIDSFSQKVKYTLEQIYECLQTLHSNGAQAGLEGTSTPYEMRINTTTGHLYIRNANNTEWYLLGEVGENFGITPEKISGVRNGGGLGKFSCGKEIDKPTLGNESNDIYFATDTSSVYIWTGVEWKKFLSLNFKDMLEYEDYCVSREELTTVGGVSSAGKVLQLDKRTGKANVDIAGSPDMMSGYLIEFSDFKA